MELPFIGETYPSRSRTHNYKRLVNWYIEEDTHGGITRQSLYPTPGLTTWLDLAGSEVRSLYVHNSYLYALVDSSLYKISSDTTATNIGTFTTSSGHIKVDSISNQIIWVDGENGYHYNTDTNTFTRSSTADPEFPSSPDKVAAINGYFIVASSNTDTFYVSDLLNGLTGWTALGFATAEGDSDTLVAIVQYGLQLYMLGERTTEIWYDSGQDVPTLKRVTNAFYTYGLAAKDSVATADGSLFFIARDNNGTNQIVRTVQNYQIMVISNRAVTYQISQYETVEDAYAFAYQKDGHEFYVVTFPTAKKSWSYDISNHTWQERESFTGTIYSQYRGNCHAPFANKNLIGDSVSGKIFYLDDSSYIEDGQPIRRLTTSAPIFFQNKRLTFYSIELLFDPAIGNDDEDDPQIMLRISRDGGNTWGNTLYGKIGKVGEYFRRVLFTKLGSGRKWIFEISVTDPNNFIFHGGFAYITPEILEQGEADANNGSTQ
jgi:hypothetical protein